ncbi:hypothetical protein, partial [Burkholderia cenocepacia]
EYERNSPRMSSNSYVNLKIATCLVRYADDRLIDQRFPISKKEINFHQGCHAPPGVHRPSGRSPGPAARASGGRAPGVAAHRLAVRHRENPEQVRSNADSR